MLVKHIIKPFWNKRPNLQLDFDEGNIGMMIVARARNRHQKEKEKKKRPLEQFNNHITLDFTVLSVHTVPEMSVHDKAE
jgi:hypothetical protein